MQQLIEKTTAYSFFRGSLSSHHALLIVCPDKEFLDELLKACSFSYFQPISENLKARIENRTFPDCIFLPEEKTFSVSDAEKIIEESTFSPLESDKKVFVVNDFSLANAPSQNKLLKLIEEPPEDVYFLFGATNVSSLLPTVLSRVEKITVPPFSDEDIVKYLQRNFKDVENAELIASQSEGYPKKAESLMKGDFSCLLPIAFSLVTERENKLPVLIKKIEDTKYKKEFLSLLRMIFRDALFLKTHREDELFFKHAKAELRVVSALPVSTLLYSQDAITEAEKNLTFFSSFPMETELLLAKIKHYKGKTV